MKTTLLNILLLVSLFFLGTNHTHNFSCSQKVEYQRNEGVQANVTKLCAPITMTTAGIHDYIRLVYNNPQYTQEILPNDFSHLIQFLKHGIATKQSRAYLQSTLRLFTNKLKACPYVNACAFNELLEQLPALLQPHFLTTRTYAIDRLQKRINTVLYSQFLEKFDRFKADPNLFFSDLSHIILDELDAANAELTFISPKEMHKAVLTFLEIGLSKLMWSPYDKQATWHTVVSISEHLTQLLENSILANTDDLNDVFVSLTERYCYFLDIAANDLPISFYREVSQQVVSTTLPLLLLEEQEDFIESKAQRLLRSLTHAEARCRSYNHGAIKPTTIRPRGQA